METEGEQTKVQFFFPPHTVWSASLAVITGCYFNSGKKLMKKDVVPNLIIDSNPWTNREQLTDS